MGAVSPKGWPRQRSLRTGGSWSPHPSTGHLFQLPQGCGSSSLETVTGKPPFHPQQHPGSRQSPQESRSWKGGRRSGVSGAEPSALLWRAGGSLGVERVGVAVLRPKGGLRPSFLGCGSPTCLSGWAEADFCLGQVVRVRGSLVELFHERSTTPQMEEEGKSLETGGGAQIQSRVGRTLQGPRGPWMGSPQGSAQPVGTGQGEGAVLGLHCWERLERI